MNRAPTLLLPAANFISQRLIMPAVPHYNIPHHFRLAASIRLSIFILRCVGG